MKLMVVYAIMLLASAAYAADLQVLELQYTAGGRLVANIFNQAPDIIDGDITVKLYDNGNEISSQTYTDPLPRYSVFSVYTDYSPTAGTHEFKAVVDGENTIKETNDGNNEKSISFEQKLDMTPRNATPEPKKQEDASETPAETGASMPSLNADQLTMVLLSVVLALGALLAIRMLHIRRKIRKEGKSSAPASPTEPKRRGIFSKKEASGLKNMAEFWERKRGLKIFQRAKKDLAVVGSPKIPSYSSVKQAMAMKPGSSARLDAKLTFNGKVGDDYTYFVSDGSGESVGISKEKLPDGRRAIDCTVESFMKDDKVLRIRSAG